MSFSISEIDDRTRLLSPSGKLRGSSAKLLGHTVESLADEGVQRVMIDLREVPSLDSLGTWAIVHGLDLGVEVIVIGASAEVTEELDLAGVAGARITRVTTLEQALTLLVMS